MKDLTRKNMQLAIEDNKPVIFTCFEEFREWYLRLHDFSMFSEEDVSALLKEERPDHYPCSPLIIDAYHGIFYLSTDNIVIRAI